MRHENGQNMSLMSIISKIARNDICLRKAAHTDRHMETGPLQTRAFFAGDASQSASASALSASLEGPPEVSGVSVSFLSWGLSVRLQFEPLRDVGEGGVSVPRSVIEEARL